MLIKVSKDLTSVTAIENGEKYTFGLNEIAETAGLLSFDKFNALTKNGSNDGINASNITSYLEEVLGVKYEEYMQNFQKAMSSIKNDANKVAMSIKQWVFPYAEWDEKTGMLVGELGKIATFDLINNRKYEIDGETRYLRAGDRIKIKDLEGKYLSSSSETSSESVGNDFEIIKANSKYDGFYYREIVAREILNSNS